MQSLFEILMMLLGVAKFIIFVQIIVSWLITFQILNMGQPLVAQIAEGLHRLTEPVYRPIRDRMPQLGGIDLAPLIVLLGIFALETILRNNAGAFY